MLDTANRQRRLAWYGITLCLFVLCFSLWNAAASAQQSKPSKTAIDAVLNPNRTPLPDPESLSREQEGYVKTTANQMVCLCGDCPRYPLGDCACPWAKRSRQVIAHAHGEGKSPEQIVSAYRQVYGDKVLGTPPDDLGLAQTGVLVPYVLAGIALLLLFVFAFRSAQKKPTEAEAPVADATAKEILRRELEDVDE